MKNTRGAGILFGPDVSSSFLKTNRLEMIIRSHELKEEGYEVMHEKKVVTIFSASHYCGTNNNLGAYMVFLDKSLRHSFHTFEVKQQGVELGSSGNKSLDGSPAASVEERAQKQTLKKLREKIFHYRHDLLFCLTQLDLKKEGLITVQEWANALNRYVRIDTTSFARAQVRINANAWFFSVLRLAIPWMELQPYLVDLEPDGRINYTKFLERYKIRVVR